MALFDPGDEPERDEPGRGDVRMAIFQPRLHKGELKAGIEQFRGQKIQVGYAWHIEANDRAMYAGEVAWHVDTPVDLRRLVTWVASGDLLFVED